MPSREALARVGRNRSFYFMGNSIARGMAFSLAALLQDTHGNWSALVVPRLSQKVQCAIGVDRSGCTVHSAGGLAVHYLPRWYHWLPRGWVDVDGDQDHCGTGDPGECIAPFLAGAGPDDVLVTNVGLEALFRIGENHRNYSAEVPLVAADAVRLFRHLALDGGFAGRAVWTTVTPTCADDGQYRYARPRFTRLLNAAVTHALADEPAGPRPRFFDHEGMFYSPADDGDAVRAELYVGVAGTAGHVDCIHPPNEGYAAAVAYVLAAVDSESAK